MFILLLLSLIPYPVLKGPSMVELNMSREADCWPLSEKCLLIYYFTVVSLPTSPTLRAL